MSKLDLKGKTLEELQRLFAELGEPSYRASQLQEWLYARRVESFAAMTNFPLALRQRLDEVALVDSLRQAVVQQAQDGTRKFLLECRDGSAIETVLLPHDYGWSVCVSSQVGCRMGCRFCASTLGGLVRNLDAGEMIDQVVHATRALPAGGRVSTVVLMGTGEPLENYEEVLKFVRLLNVAPGIHLGYRHLTLSTAGLIPGIRRLMGEGLPITLAVSLHAPDDELRRSIMPIARRYPLDELLPACQEYAETTGRRVTFEYVLLKDLNDSPGHATRLAERLRGMLCHVNVIMANPVPERRVERSDPGRAAEFVRVLERAGVPVTLRRELGSKIDAACGQLRRRAPGGGSGRGGRK